MNIHVLFLEKKQFPTSGGAWVDVSEPRKSGPHWAHHGELFPDSPTQKNLGATPHGAEGHLVAGPGQPVPTQLALG